MITLNKGLDPADLEDDDVKEVLRTVDLYFDKDAPQHFYRRWEYSVGLLAYELWEGTAGHTLDVGGAGSPFWRMLPNDAMRVIDPQVGESLEEYVYSGGRLSDAVFCFSVLEHLAPEDLDSFLYHLSCATAPGGLLVLTMDSCGDEGLTCSDPHHYNWMRKQIFTKDGVERIRQALHQFDFKTFGEQDDTVVNPHVIHDYFFRSVVMTKRLR